MAQTKTIQLLRSSQVYANLEAAKTGIQGATGTRQDGELLLGRYWSGETNPVIKSVIGIYHAAPDLTGTGVTQGETQGWTFIQDITSSSEGLQELRDELDATQTGAGLSTTGSYVVKTGDAIIGQSTSITGAVNAIADYIQTMDLEQVGGTSGDVITAVSQADGKVSASKSSLTDVVMTGYSKTSDTGAIAATDTVEQAFSKLENTITNTTVKSSDKTVNITDNNGKDLSVNIDGQTLVKDATDGTISSALKVIKVIPTGTAGDNEVVDETLGTNIKEAYRLVYGSSNTAIGKQINIYKDSALKEVYLGASTDTIDASTGTITKNTVTDPQSMNFAYQLSDGTYSLTKVDVSKFLSESEFGDGLQVSGGAVSVKVGNGLEIDSTSKAVNVKRDSTSESFLTVGANGVKLSGVQDAIDAVKVTTDNTGATYVNLAVDDATGRALTLTNTMQAMASADSTHQGLAEASDVKTYVDNAVAGKNVTAEGDVYVSATAENNKVTVATDVQGLTFTQGSGSTNSTLTGTAQSLADGADIATKVSSFTNARIDEEIAKLDSSVAATAASGNVYSVLTGVTEVDGKLTDKTEVTLAAVAKTGAAADVTVADSNNKLTATNVEDALAEIVDKADAALNSVSSANGAIAVGIKDSNKNQALTFQVGSNCAKQGDGATNMLTIENDGLVLNSVWDCGTF
jgi:hypothetical protein